VTSLVLLAFAVVLALAGSQLRRVRLFDRAPRLGVAAWQSMSLAAISAVTLAGITLIVPASSLGGDLASLLRACVFTLRAAYAAPTELPGVTAGAVLAAGTTAWASAWIGWELCRARRDRARTRDALALVARHDASLDATVVENDLAAAYCLPGRRDRIVLTTAAVAALDRGELAAVIAHERAHLRQRHHLAVAAAQGLARAFPRIPLFAVGAVQVARLVELAADDAAASDTDGISVAGALVALAGMSAPVSALAAASSVGAVRVKRLLEPAQAVGAARRAGVVVALSLIVTAPALLAAYPAFAAASAEVCTLPTV
jgi:Zn-dependent protease with chaperone function